MTEVLATVLLETELLANVVTVIVAPVIAVQATEVEAAATNPPTQLTVANPIAAKRNVVTRTVRKLSEANVPFVASELVAKAAVNREPNARNREPTGRRVCGKSVRYHRVLMPKSTMKSMNSKTWTAATR